MIAVLRRLIRPAFYLSHNILSQLGVAITTTSALTLISLYTTEFFGIHVGPYAGIVAFFVLPALFILGLLMIAAGLALRYRKEQTAGTLPREYPQVDFADARLRETMQFVVMMTIVNVVIFLTATYKAVDYMDTTQFCGATCHTPMTPEYTAYQHSAHSHVACVECHVGPGISGFVAAKAAGTRQLMGVMFHNYHRPIPTPVHGMRPASETCDHCHAPGRFTGDKLWVDTKFSSDEKNTRLTTVLVLKIGGVNEEGAQGIHGRHLDTGTSRIEYISTDLQRQAIPSVRSVNDKGQAADFFTSDVKVTSDQLAKGEHRVMECMDCHNRPAHTFQLPERAMDKAMNQGIISVDLPFVKKESVELLKVNYPDRDTAEQQIPAGLVNYYKTTYPAVYSGRQAQVEAAAGEVKNIYMRNVFPDMKVTWGSHLNNLGHEDFLGCFRCHDGNHTAKDGRVITNDCNACHTLVAVDDPNPKVLTDLSMKED
jgi:nitrate/TMAO reductase-like tetraheme cytochrome c subunit